MTLGVLRSYNFMVFGPIHEGQRAYRFWRVYFRRGATRVSVRASLVYQLDGNVKKKRAP